MADGRGNHEQQPACRRERGREAAGRDERDDPGGELSHLGRCKHDDVLIRAREPHRREHLAAVDAVRAVAVDPYLMLVLEVEHVGRGQGARAEDLVVAVVRIAHDAVAIVEPIDEPGLLPVLVPLGQRFHSGAVQTVDHEITGEGRRCRRGHVQRIAMKNSAHIALQRAARTLLTV